MKIQFTACLLLLVLWGAAAKDTYSVREIPAELLVNSNAVVRDESERFEIHDVRNATYSYRRAVTILNKKADAFSSVKVYYDGKSTVASLEGAIFDKHGKLARKLKKSDIKDYSAFDGYSIIDDGRFKEAELNFPDYPYTIVFEYVVKQKNILRYPTWAPLPGYNLSCQWSEFEVINAKDLELRYLEKNIPANVSSEIDAANGKFKWNIKNAPALMYEAMAPHATEILPLVRTSPTRFVTYAYQGDMSDWKGYGQWVYALLEDKQKLPDATAKKMQEMVKDCSDDIDKVRRIYQYMQNNTRYISVSLGLGGWQPFDATYVNEKGYGDCKALSNYMMSLLKSVGINSHYTLIRAGSNEPSISVDFPSHQFNHAILCVPMEKDTLWLECTDQKNPFGYVGSGLDNRHVLLITEDGGYLTRTPGWTGHENIQFTNARVDLDTEGNATAEVEIVSAGLQFSRVDALLKRGREEQRKRIYNFIDIPQFELQDFKVNANTGADINGLEEYQLQLRRYGAAGGKRVFFQPNLLNKNSNVRLTSESRINPLVLRFPYLDIDTIEFNLPNHCHLEFVPENIRITSDFGSYEVNFEIEQGKVVYIRRMEMYNGTFPSEKYNEYIQFMNQIAEADQMKIVMLKST
ncbi:MAG: DUF3857 domain-containing protein [Cyclobacteriaceae bacterium]|nr:DUF3857 domain-containing protein [Cyclobacteriaceae bacterium]